MPQQTMLTGTVKVSDSDDKGGRQIDVEVIPGVLIYSIPLNAEGAQAVSEGLRDDSPEAVARKSGLHIAGAGDLPT